jgi:hypothetical protein
MYVTLQTLQRRSDVWLFREAVCVFSLSKTGFSNLHHAEAFDSL